MYSQPQQELVSFTTATSQAIAHIQMQRQHAKDIQHQTNALRQHTDKMKTQRNSLVQLSTRLQKLSSSITFDPSLTQIFYSSPQRSRPKFSQQKEEHQILFPKIEVPQLKWVIKRLEEIKEENLSEEEENVKRRRKTLVSLGETIVKYEEKLKRLENKLAEGYEQIRSKKSRPEW